MTCSSCGAYVTPSVHFCSNCGAAVNDPEATRIARMQSRALDYNGSTDLEQTVFTVRPTMIFIKAGYVLAVLAGLALVFFLAWLGAPAWISILLALRRNMVKYTVTDSKLQIDTGLIARTTKNIPLSKVQDVTVSASIPQRLMGFGDIIIDNASEIGGSIVMHNISSPRHYADLLLRELRRWH
jgi:uncharacterized membrane protein YdbT with pleckstrin-like domain